MNTIHLFESLFPVDPEARKISRDARDAVEELRDRVDRMALFTMALWSLAGEKLNITEDELKKRVQDLDLSDGKLDGKISQTVGQCPKCKKQLSKRNRSCLYCGFKLATTFPG